MRCEHESRNGIADFSVDEYVRPSNGEPIRSVVLETNDSVIVVWHATLGGNSCHVHPHGQDTWTVISGEAEYYQGDGVATHIKAGDIAIAKPGQSTWCNELWPRTFIFVSVVAPANAGFALAENKQPHMSAKLLRSNNRLHGDRFPLLRSYKPAREPNVMPTTQTQLHSQSR